jgi:SAM-dependent methyltransferase
LRLIDVLKAARRNARRLTHAAARRLPIQSTRQERSAPPATGQNAGAQRFYPDTSFEDLPAAVEKSLEGVALGEHRLTRLAMYRALSNALAEHDGLSKRCLAISGSSRLASVLGLKAARIVEAHFPEHTMLALSFPDAAFDFCISDQVLEHVEGNPFDAVRESFRVVRPGGFVVHTTCLLNPIHREPGDFWRFTPDALALLCRSAGGDVITAGAWGNREALSLTEAGLRMLKVPVDPEHPLHRIAALNEPDWPIHSWVVAKTPT